MLKLISKAAFGCLWCYVLVLPWEVSTQFSTLGSVPRLVGLVASAVGVFCILGRRRFRRLSWFHVFAILFVLWAGLSSWWSIDPDATRAVFLTYLQLAVSLWLIWEMAWSPEPQRALLSAYVLGAGVAAVATVYNYLAGAAYRAAELTELRFAAMNQNPNELGSTLALGLPMAWYVSLSQPHRRFAWMWQLYVPLGITAILLNASRGATVTALVGLLLIPWTLERRRLRTKVALSCVGVASLVLASRFVPEASLERIKNTPGDIAATYFGDPRPGDAVRGQIWIAGLEAAREHPLAGAGAGAFGAAVEPTLNYGWASHQALLSILVEHGIVGLCLFLGMIAAEIVPVRHLPSLERRFSIVLLLALAAGSLSLNWEHHKQFWFVLGIVAAQAAQRSARPHHRHVRASVSSAGREAAT